MQPFWAPEYNIYVMMDSGAESSSGSSGSGSKVGGGVAGALLLIGAAITTMIALYFLLKWKTKKRMKKLQMDIFAM